MVTKIGKPPAVVGCTVALAIALIAECFYEKTGNEVGSIKVILPDARFFPDLLFFSLERIALTIPLALGESYAIKKLVSSRL